MFDFIETSKGISGIQSKVESTLLRNNLQHLYQPSTDKSDSVRLVFAGQYNAGKSTILRMLTGDNSIAVGEGITTQ